VIHDPLGLIRAAELLRSSMLGMAAAIGVLAVTAFAGVAAVAWMFARHLATDRAYRDRLVTDFRFELRRLTPSPRDHDS